MKTKTPAEIFEMSTCLFKYWSEEEPRELANVIAHLLTKSASQTIKKRQGRYVPKSLISALSSVEFIQNSIPIRIRILILDYIRVSIKLGRRNLENYWNKGNIFPFQICFMSTGHRRQKP